MSSITQKTTSNNSKKLVESVSNKMGSQKSPANVLEKNDGMSQNMFKQFPPVPPPPPPPCPHNIA